MTMLNLFRHGPDPHLLVVGMTGVKLGERFVQIGCAHGGRLGAIAARVGLSGRAVVVVPDERAAARARKGAAEAGVLLDVEIAPPTDLPLASGEFDLVVIDATGDVTGLPPHQRAAAVREALRVLRPGGRTLVIAQGRRTGLAALLPSTPSAWSAEAESVLKAGGFGSVRTLADREGLVFVEGIKPRPG